MAKRPRKEYVSYSDKLRDPRWQRVRLEIMGRDKFKCRQCSDESTTLNVHHQYYEKGRDPWEYPPETLHTLCETCHEEIEEAKLNLLKALVTKGDFDMALRFVKTGHYGAFLASVNDFIKECDDADGATDECDLAFTWMVRMATTRLDATHSRVYAPGPEHISQKSQVTPPLSPAPVPAPSPRILSPEESLWEKVRDEFSRKYPLQGGYAAEVRPMRMEGPVLVLGVPTEHRLAALNLERPTCRAALADILKTLTGHPLTTRVEVLEEVSFQDAKAGLQAIIQPKGAL